ncbi:MAG: LysR family transcriptional regulator [Rhodobiaceae bacterium]|nr:LysR family transcriptional regulator [Rhodobiaceae bacterium]MCC0048609.1 LysR family transcriptional regulator [Rhodobiaceae bacterium]
MKRVDQISLRQLRALDAVLTHGTISAAAQAMGLTGPAVHNQLKTLEEIIGSPLIYREGRQRNSATPQGGVLSRANAELRATLERAILNINALNSGHSGCVVIGAVSTAKYLAPRIIALLESEFPGLELVLKIANRSDTIEALSDRALDLCIMGRPPRHALNNAVPLANHPHIIIAAPDHRLSGRDDVSVGELLDERIILREQGSGTRLLATRFIEEIADGQELTTMEMDSNETIKQAVMNGLGIALISAHTVSEEVGSGRLVRLKVPGTPIIRKWYLIAPREFEPTQATKHVRAWLERNFAAHVPELQY